VFPVTFSTSPGLSVSIKRSTGTTESQVMPPKAGERFGRRLPIVMGHGDFINPFGEVVSSLYAVSFRFILGLPKTITRWIYE